MTHPNLPDEYPSFDDDGEWTHYTVLGCIAFVAVLAVVLFWAI